MRDAVIGNGRLTLAYDARGCIREVYYPQPGLWNHSLGAPSHIGFQSQGITYWLGETTPAPRLQATGREVQIIWKDLDQGLEVHLQDCLDSSLPLLRRHFHLRGVAGAKVTLLLHHDFRLLETENLDGVRFCPSQRFLLHYKRQQNIGVGLVEPSSWAVRWTLGRRDGEDGRGIRALVERQGLDNNPCAVGAGESVLGIDVVLDDEGHARISSYVAAWQEQEEKAQIDSSLKEHSSHLVAPDTREETTASTRTLVNHAKDLLSVFGSAVIASPDSESLEVAKEHYGYIWPRDGAFVAMTWDALGEHTRARRFYDFCEKALLEEGYLLQRYHPDGTPGSSWHPEPQSKSRLRPIQEDSTALCCLAASRHFLSVQQKSQASARHLAENLILPSARFLVSYRDEESGLPLPSHDLWEERFGIHTFTVAAVIAALKSAAEVARILKREEARQFQTVAESMDEALQTRLFHQDAGRFARTATVQANGSLHLDATPDASLCGLFLFDHGKIHDPLVQRTMTSIEEELWVRNGVGGMARYHDDHYHRRSHDPDKIPGNPWIICTLWLAQWHALAGDDEGRLRAESLLTWVADRARPSGALPEQVHPTTGENVSVCPLVWSHSTLIDAFTALNPKG